MNLKYHLSTKNNWLVEICNTNHWLINVQFILNTNIAIVQTEDSDLTLDSLCCLSMS